MQDLTAFSIRPDVGKHGPLKWKFSAFVLAKLRGQKWIWPLSMTFRDFSSHLGGFPQPRGELLDLAIYFIEVSSVPIVGLGFCFLRYVSLNIFSHFPFEKRKFLSNGSHQIKCLQLLKLFKSLEKSLFMREPFWNEIAFVAVCEMLEKAFNALTIKRSCYLCATKPVEKLEVSV